MSAVGGKRSFSWLVFVPVSFLRKSGGDRDVFLRGRELEWNPFGAFYANGRTSDAEFSPNSKPFEERTVIGTIQ